MAGAASLVAGPGRSPAWIAVVLMPAARFRRVIPSSFQVSGRESAPGSVPPEPPPSDRHGHGACRTGRTGPALACRRRKRSACGKPETCAEPGDLSTANSGATAGLRCVTGNVRRSRHQSTGPARGGARTAPATSSGAGTPFDRRFAAVRTSPGRANRARGRATRTAREGTAIGFRSAGAANRRDSSPHGPRVVAWPSRAGGRPAVRFAARTQRNRRIQ